MLVKAYAAMQAGGKLEPIEYDLGPLPADQVEIEVAYCGICHSDLSMLDNEWGNSRYPLVPGHEIVGRVAAVGDQVKHVAAGQHVGLGWLSASCNACEWCLSGNQNLCLSRKATIVGRYGGFADRVRAQAQWVIPLPQGVPAEAAGPLFCGGITVFNPILQYNVRPTDRVGVIGIGGLGHMALQFLHAWGCEVTAFSGSPAKEDEARRMGADHFIHSKDGDALKKAANSFDFILSTVNAPLDWPAYLAALRPQGRLHLVGVVLKPIPVPVGALMFGQKSISASPVGSPGATARMLDFAARHHIAPVIETFPMAQANEAMERLKSGQARYRIVLKQ